MGGGGREEEKGEEDKFNNRNLKGREYGMEGDMNNFTRFSILHFVFANARKLQNTRRTHINRFGTHLEIG